MPRNLFSGPQRNKVIAGFSLIELMVTVSIVILVTGISLARYGSFNNSVLLKSQAYEIALDIRQTQLYGVSVSTKKGNFNYPFGAYFKASDNTYIIFQDANESGTFDDDTEQIGDSYFIDPRFEITEIVSSCSPTATLDEIVILFKRPNFDAIMQVPSCGQATSVSITLAAAAGSTASRTVNVNASGLISVQ